MLVRKTSLRKLLKRSTWESFCSVTSQQKPDLEDPNQTSLWVSFEKFLVHQFPDAKKIATPWHDPMFEDYAYEPFLQFIGYEKIAQSESVSMG
jgi:hypothetical protein